MDTMTLAGSETAKLADAKRVLFSTNASWVELVDVCPAEFRRDNKWSNFAVKLFVTMRADDRASDHRQWEWQLDPGPELERRFARFREVCRNVNLPPDEHKAVAGWMLHELLFDVPRTNV
jgi:hypothetical protein